MEKVSEYTSKIKVLREEIERVVAPLKQQVADTIKAGLKECTDAFFAEHPEVKTISWQQYIPTFNDGDACLFTMGDIYFSPVDYREHEYEYWGEEQEGEMENFSTYNDVNKVANGSSLEKDISEMETFLNSIDDYLEDAFGSDAWIRLHRDGVEFEEIEPPY